MSVAKQIEDIEAEVEYRVLCVFLWGSGHGRSIILRVLCWPRTCLEWRRSHDLCVVSADGPHAEEQGHGQAHWLAEGKAGQVETRAHHTHGRCVSCWQMTSRAFSVRRLRRASLFLSGFGHFRCCESRQWWQGG